MWSYADVFKNMEREKRIKAQKEARKKKLERSSYRLVRIAAELRVGGALEKATVIPARLFLNDFSDKQVRLFVSSPVAIDRKVTVHIQDEKTFQVKGSITRCVHYALDSHIIADLVFPYRIDIKLQFKNEKEALNVRSYAQSIYQKYVLGHEDEIAIINDRDSLKIPQRSPLKVLEQDDNQANIPAFEDLEIFKKGA